MKDVMVRNKSPYLHDRMRAILEFLKVKYGLPSDGFNMPIIQLCGIKTCFAAIY